MIPKTVLLRIVEKQLKSLEDRFPGQTRHMLSAMPYLTDRALLLGGIRGAGRRTLLLQMMRSEYPQAWYADFEDPRLAGLDAGDFGKLEALIVESGRGVVLLDRVDRVEGWISFLCGLLDGGFKVVATVSLGTLLQLKKAQRIRLRGEDPASDRCRMPGPRPGARKTRTGARSASGAHAMRPGTKKPRKAENLPLRMAEPAERLAGPVAPEKEFDGLQTSCDRFILCRVPLFSYAEFLEFHRKRPGETSLQEYMHRGAFPDQQKTTRLQTLYDLYETILSRDVLLANGIRDQETLRRIAIRLLSSSGEYVTANALRKELKVKAVTTVTEHMDHLQRSGLISFVPYWSENPAQRYVNPRKVYAVDTALAAALTLRPQVDRSKSFETLIFNYLADRYEELFYTSEEGGCDFVAFEENRAVLCVQACYEGENSDLLQQKAEGLLRAMTLTGAPRGVIVTAGFADRILCGDREVEVTDADTFLNE